MLAVQAQQLKRQPIVVVQVPLRLEHVEARVQHRGYGFFRGRLAGRTGNGDDALAPVATHGGRQALQSQQRTIDQKQRTLSGRIGQGGQPLPGMIAAVAPRSKAAARKSWPSRRSP